MIGRLHHFSRAEAAARADELLERFELTDAANRAVKTYSGGMRRRLDLGASLVNRPAVLFLGADDGAGPPQPDVAVAHHSRPGL